MAMARVGMGTRVWRSFHASIGDIAFGMEDGAVSIAGLVFGVAASTSDSHVVLLAGATGAAAGAVSMMAGTYLDVESVRDRAAALRSAAARRIRANPAGEQARVVRQLRAMGLSEDEAASFGGALSRHPSAMLDYVAAMQLGLGRSGTESPMVHASWMFLADLCAAAIPVVPFALFELDVARLVSLFVTGLLLALLGLGRGRIAHKNVLVTMGQTLAIAAAAAAAGVLMGRFVSR